MKLYGSIFRLSEWVVMTPKYEERTYRGKPGDYTLKAALARFGNTELELVQPLEGHSTNADHLAKKGEGLHHIGISVDNFSEKKLELEKLGFQMIQSGQRPGAVYAYFQKEDESSIIIEIFERSQKIEFE